MTDEMNLRDKVLDSISDDKHQRIVSITFPNKVYRRFRAWSEENANSCFWLAIEKLLDNYEQNQGTNLGEVNDKIDFLTSVVANLEQEIVIMKMEKNTKVQKSFGRKEEE